MKKKLKKPWLYIARGSAALAGQDNILTKRTITSLVGIAFLLAVFWAGSLPFTLLVGLSAILAAGEFYNLFPLGKKGIFYGLGLALIFLVVLGPSIEEKLFFLFIFAVLIIFMLWINVRENIREQVSLHNGWRYLVGILFIGFLLSYFVSLVNIERGREWVILALFTTFAADSGAFLAGSKWGKNKIAPKISPHKTWEGALAGLISALLVGFVLFKMMNLGDSWALAIIPGFLIGMLSPLGDLAMSFFKRKAGVKDSGRLLPGHGGLLDRIDSLLISGIVIYYYAMALSILALR